MIQLLVALLLAAVVYVPETIDTLPTSPYAQVAVSGIVSGMHLQGEAISFRLTDPHGHVVECLIPAGSAVTLPSVGKPLVVKGTRKVTPRIRVSPTDPPTVSIDPVASIELIDE